nr:hypothetical protein Iba_chr07bCG8900 [Ipomoea batatas]
MRLVGIYKRSKGDTCQDSLASAKLSEPKSKYFSEAQVEHSRLVLSTTRISQFEIDYDVMVEVGSFSVSLYDTVIEEIEQFSEVRGESLSAVANEPLKRSGMPSTSLPKDVDTSTRIVELSMMLDEVSATSSSATKEIGSVQEACLPDPNQEHDRPCRSDLLRDVPNPRDYAVANLKDPWHDLEKNYIPETGEVTIAIPPRVSEPSTRVVRHSATPPKPFLITSPPPSTSTPTNSSPAPPVTATSHRPLCHQRRYSPQSHLAVATAASSAASISPLSQAPVGSPLASTTGSDESALRLS